MSERCHIFDMPDAEEACSQLDLEEVEDYGEEKYGHFLHVWDQGSRKLMRCRRCGAYVLVQRSVFLSFVNAPNSEYTDWFPVSGPEQADSLNRTYDGHQLERCFEGRYLRSTNGVPYWSDEEKA
ncbi:MAG: hypothetical protein IKX27_05085 [Oscillospiraceae bacterium]|nr:hypothetical protein [Oscillospiraceae bacterium]